MLPVSYCRAVMRGGSPKAGRTSAANRASVRVQSSPLPLSLAGGFIGIQGLTYYQWPAHNSRREFHRLPIRFWFPLVAHDSDDVITLGDSFQMSLPVGATVNGSRRMYLTPNSFPS
jgi:hypothetical protein